MRLLTLTLLGTTLLLGCGNHNEPPAETHHHTAMAAKSPNSDRKATCEICKATSPCTRPSDVNTWVNQHTKEHPDHNKYKFEDCAK